MPAEWEPHAATWLSWPRKNGISFPDRFEPIPAIWARMASLLREHEEVHINYFDPAHSRQIRKALNLESITVGEGVFLHHFPAYEPWCRDHGPIFITKGKELALIDWEYNAWGGKYPPFDLDDQVPTRVASFLKVPCHPGGMVLEGGSIEVNGQGTLLTTEQCLLNPNRNPDWGRVQIEQQLMDFLGVTKILWLGEGIVGDDTDGHIDDLTRFVDPKTVVTIVEEDPLDANYKLLQENRKRLDSMTTAKGEKLRVLELPTPGVVEHEGQRLPASYANFYIGNKVVLLPVFNHKNDELARGILQSCFSDRRVVSIPALDLIWGLGAFHCITQQQPKP